MYWRKDVLMSVKKLFKGIHNNSGRLERDLYWRKRRFTSTKKLTKGIQSNGGIVTAKVLKILFQVPSNSSVIIFLIYWCIFRGKVNGSNSSSINWISWIDNQKLVDTVLLKTIRIFITCFPPFAIAGRSWILSEVDLWSGSVIRLGLSRVFFGSTSVMLRVSVGAIIKLSLSRNRADTLFA